MKATESKTSAAQIQAKKEDNQPFFSREEQHGVFASEKPFFTTGDSPGNAFFNPAPVAKGMHKATHPSPSIQTKLTVGAPDDMYEKEADAMADQVVQRLAAPTAAGEDEQRKEPETAIQRKPAGVQRACSTCAAEKEEKIQEKPESAGALNPFIQRKPIFESGNEPPEEGFSSAGGGQGGGSIQRMCSECAAEQEEEQHLHKKSDGSGESVASSDVSGRLSARKGGGSPLPEPTRNSMESAFGADFSGVRIHTDSNAVQLSRDLSAQAFTHGSDVYFNSGKYNPSTGDGQRLLAHELTHTIQQGSAVRRKLDPTHTGSKAKPAPMPVKASPVPVPTPAPAIQRKAEPETELAEEKKGQADLMRMGAAPLPPPEEEESIQRKAGDGGGSVEAPAGLESQIQNSKGKGASLEGGSRRQMENTFQTDFSSVNIHADTQAAVMSQQLSAQAFTHGSDVYFGAGKYSPGTTEGDRLLAHELTHVGQQQKGAQPALRRLPDKTTREEKGGSKGRRVMHYTHVDNQGKITEKHIGYRKAEISQFIIDAEKGVDMDKYVGKLEKDELYMIPIKARGYAILNVSFGNYVDDREEKFINDLIEFILPDEIPLFKAIVPAFYKVVSEELDDEEQIQRFNRLMNGLNQVNTEAVKQVREELRSGDFDLDDNAARLGIKDLQQLSIEERVKIIQQIGIDDWVITDEDGDTVIRIIESLESENNPTLFFEYLHSKGTSSLYDKLIQNLTGPQTTLYYALLGKYFPDVPDIAKYKRLDALFNYRKAIKTGKEETPMPKDGLDQSDDIVATFSEFDFVNLEANDNENGVPKGTFRLSLIKDLLEGFTGDDDENSLINLLTIWSNNGAVTGPAKSLVVTALLDNDLNLLRQVHYATDGAEYEKLKQACEKLFQANDRFQNILLDAIDGKLKTHLETIAHYTPKTILAALSQDKKVALVKQIEAGWWTDAWDEETLLHLFQAVKENQSPEERQSLYDELDQKVGIAEVKDDFQGDNYAFGEQALNNLNDKGSVARIDAAIKANLDNSISEYYSYDDTIGALTDNDLQNESITLDIRKKFILGIIGRTVEERDNASVGDYDEMTLIRIIKNTPASQASGMVQWLGNEKGAVYQYLHRAIDGLEFEQFHEALNDLSKLDYFMLGKTKYAHGDFEKLRGRQNQIHEIKSLGLRHDKVVPFSHKSLLSQIIFNDVSVSYDVWFSDDNRITVQYAFSGSGLDKRTSDVDLSLLIDTKTFDASEMIGVYFLFDDEELHAKAGEIKVMSAFNLFHLENTKSNRNIWEAVDIASLAIGIGEFKAATKLGEMAIAIVDITLSSASIVQSSFRNELPADVRDAIDYANIVFGGYMALKMGKAGIKMGKKALDNLIGKTAQLSEEQRRALETLIEGYEQQLILAEMIEGMTPEELQRALGNIPDLDDGIRLELGKAFNSLAPLTQNIDPKAIRYLYNGHEVPEALMLELLKDHEWLKEAAQSGKFSLNLQNPSPEISKAYQEAMAALGDSDAGKMLKGADGTKALPDGSTKGSALAKKLGYPNPELGYHWAEVNGELVYKRNPFNAEGPKLPERYYDPESKSFKNVEPKAPADVPIDGDLITNAQKGKFGEQKAIEFMDQEGFALRGSHDAPGVGGGNPKPQGIDGVYENMKYPPPPKWVVGEAKFGDSGYGWTKGPNGERVKQLSTPWTDARLDHAVGRKLADQIRLDGYERWELRVDPSGKVTKTKIIW